MMISVAILAQGCLIMRGIHDPSLEYWQVHNHESLLDVILDVVLVRRACDSVDGDGPDAPWMQPLRSKVPNVVFAFPTEPELECFLAKDQEVTLGELQATMKLNYEPNDHCSISMAAAIGRATKDNKFLWAYMTSRCSGRGFTDLAAKGIKGTTVLEVLEWAWDQLDDKREFFSAGFAPQKRLRQSVKNMSKTVFLTPKVLKEVFDIECRPARPRFRNADSRWKTKKSVMMDVKSAHGSGPFLAKHFWRIYNRCNPSQLPDDKTYSECGSGARAFLLLEQGLPQRYGITNSGQSACDFFNTYLQRFISRLKAALIKRIKHASCPRERYWFEVLQRELLRAPEAAQFVCCEGVKLLRFLVTRSALYLRGESGSCVLDSHEDEI